MRRLQALEKLEQKRRMRHCPHVTLLLTILVLGTLCWTTSKADIGIGDVRTAIQDRQFSDAVKLIDLLLADSEEESDLLMYLRSLSLFYGGDFPNAIMSCDNLISKYESSAWHRKAVFLKAQCYIQLRQFEKAERIYDAEVRRLLSAARKDQIAGICFRYGEELSHKPDKGELDAPPPDYRKAYEIYKSILELEISRGMKDEVMFRLGRMMQLAEDFEQAAEHYRRYLSKFDIQWMKPLDSLEELEEQERPSESGKHIYEARYHLAECQMAAKKLDEARFALQDLLRMVPKSDTAGEKVVRDATHLMISIYDAEDYRGDGRFALAVKAARDFLKTYPRDARAISVAYRIGQLYESRYRRTEGAIKAYREFLNMEYSEPTLGVQDMDESGESHTERFQRLRMSALYRLGALLSAQKKHTEAIEMWNQYIAQYPNGTDWSNAQKGIVDAEFGMGLGLLREKKYEKAFQVWDKFMEKYPLDGRLPEIMWERGRFHLDEHLPGIVWVHGQEHYGKAEAGQKEDGYRKAISEWEKLANKYPDSEKASLALFNIGKVYEESLRDPEKALAAYRKVTWKTFQGRAKERIRGITEKKLQLVTERSFRTNEPALVKLTLRNIEKVTVNVYKVDLEAYWRKMRSIVGSERLDVALIAPDKTWEYEIPDYGKYVLYEQSIEIPMEGAEVYMVNITDDDLEATALVIRSDIEAIVKVSRKEALVFVEDVLRKEPAPGARVLISDGSKVIGEGVTGDDGVFHSKLEGLKDASRVSAFVAKDGSVASDLMDTTTLELSAGLKPRGYIYTHRPAYRPGQQVFIRGIIRDVKDGSYSVSPGEIYRLSVTDSQGRLIWSEEVKLSIFGTFHTGMTLDENAPTGEYGISAEIMEDGEKQIAPSKLFTETFQVLRYQLEKIKLNVDFTQDTYFPGERIEATFTASYYYGQPVIGKTIRYIFPDGRSYAKETDSSGKVRAVFDTTTFVARGGGSPRGTRLEFSGSIEGENVTVKGAVFLAQQGFHIRIEWRDHTVIAGEPFDVSIQTKGADYVKPVGRDLTLTVNRRIGREEVRVEERQIRTDNETGRANIWLTLEEGGDYRIRVEGKDRLGNPVTREDRITVSDDEDEVKFRIFTKQSKLRVGERGEVRVHSRIKSADGTLALVTFEGEGIIDYSIIELEAGWNGLEFAVGHEHFPNFHLAITAIDGLKLRTAGMDFAVERQMKISLDLKAACLPGEEVDVQVTATDQLGNPVEAKISLALVDEALFTVYKGSFLPITDFFNKGVHRDAAMRTVSTCNFRHEPPTQRVVNELVEEDERLEQHERFTMGRGKLLDALESNGVIDLRSRAQYKLSDKGIRIVQEMARESFSLGDALSRSRVPPLFGEARLTRYRKPKPRERYAPDVETIREELANAGYWLPAVITDAKGKATVRLLMPQTISQWRLTARGCTAETLVGQAIQKTITRKDFFLDVKVPPILTEGDKARVVARVHNLTDFAGEAELRLKLSIDGKDVAENEKSANIGKKTTTEVVFNGIEISAGREVKVEVIARAGEMTDGISRTISIRPWGMEHADSKSGLISGSETVFLQLPENVEFSSRRMTINIGQDTNRLIFDLAMNRTQRVPPVPGDAGSDLLAAAYALRYLKKAGGDPTDNVALHNYAGSLVARLVITQRDDGGWSWCGGSADSDIHTSSRTLWALVEARHQGISIHPQTIEKATSYLKSVFAQVGQNDYEAKSVILHALSLAGEADFAYANRLYRNRNRMSLSSLAYSALVFANLDRKKIGSEILDVLEAKKTEHTGSISKAEETQTTGSVETTALSLLAMEAIRPDSPLVKETVEYLLSKRDLHGYSPYKARGPAVAALAVYYGKTQFTGSDYRLKVSVNGDGVESIEVTRTGNLRPRVVNVPAKYVKDGQNKIEFHLEGEGRYAYTATLSGFSPKFGDTEAWDRPFIQSRKYYHAPLEYGGRQVAASTTEITQLPNGERTYVSVDVEEEDSDRYLVIHEYLPAGTMLVDGSVSGSHQHYQAGDGLITFYYPPGGKMRDYKYQLMSYAPGSYGVMPTIIRDAMRPGEMRVGSPASLEVLATGEKSKDEYRMNDRELYGLGKAYFDDGKYDEALPLLSQLFQQNQEYEHGEVARMLLWIRTEDNFYEAGKVMEYFEVLRERFPELYIPFHKILVVGQAYGDVEEYERAFLVYRAALDASFASDSKVSAVLEDAGRSLRSISFQKDLWRQYPDLPQVVSSHFALSQSIYSRASAADVLDAEEGNRISSLDLLKETGLMLAQFLTLYPDNPLADDASFSFANVLLDLEDFQSVVGLSQLSQKRYPESEYLTSFQYVEALGSFSQHKYDEAIKVARLVADGKSRDRDLARYILGQIYHARGKPEMAMDWYGRVKDIYADAQESISYFQEKKISLDEVEVVRPGDKAEVTIKYRNVREASLQVYEVDLMKLYLREKDLSSIRSVQLAGIEPEYSVSIPLGDGKDYVDRELRLDLGLKEDGAYLVICRGDDLFTSGLLLLTPLEIEVQEEAISGRVRVNVRDTTQRTYREGVHVKVVGSAEKEFRSGRTDLRGLLIADDIRGKATVIARDGKDRYAFYRGERWLGAIEEEAQEVAGIAIESGESVKVKVADFGTNIRMMNESIQVSNIEEFDQMRRLGQKGVQVQMAD
ncbi:tetratricopeptide repeat protein [Candidatus Poribacteria bacterium]